MRYVSLSPFVTPRPLLFVALTVALGAGCSSRAWPVASARYVPAAASPSLHFLSATGDDDDELPPDETVRLLEPEPSQLPADLAVTRREPGSRMRIGVRGGMLQTSGTERAWEDALAYGLFFRQSPRKRKKVVIELGADYVDAKTVDGFVTSTLYLLHADLLIGGFGPRGGTMYIFLGGHGVVEESTNTVTLETSSGQGGGAEAGIGLGAKSGAWDMRATYSYLTASENATDNLTFSFGLSF